MKAINLDITVRIYNDFLWAENIAEIIKDYDFVIDGTDNFPTKYLVNDACIFLGIPFSHAGIPRFNGQTMIIFPGWPACCRSSFRKQPP